MDNATHTYKGQLVKLVELTYMAYGWQYCTIEMTNKVGKKQHQTVQVRRLSPLPVEERAVHRRQSEESWGCPNCDITFPPFVLSCPCGYPRPNSGQWRS